MLNSNRGHQFNGGCNEQNAYLATPINLTISPSKPSKAMTTTARAASEDYFAPQDPRLNPRTLGFIYFRLHLPSTPFFTAPPTTCRPSLASTHTPGSRTFALTVERSNKNPLFASNIIGGDEQNPMEVNRMTCKPCARNGRKVNGGDLGYCANHRRTKCLVCRAPSLGEELCAAHAHAVETRRWIAQSQFRVIDQDSEIDLAEIRKSKLQEAKFLTHQAVEVLFRAMFNAIEAMYGNPETDEEKEAA